MGLSVISTIANVVSCRVHVDISNVSHLLYTKQSIKLSSSFFHYQVNKRALWFHMLLIIGDKCQGFGFLVLMIINLILIQYRFLNQKHYWNSDKWNAELRFIISTPYLIVTQTLNELGNSYLSIFCWLWSWLDWLASFENLWFRVSKG